ncbi:hypothetical protein BT69DRAFT_1325562 [Atractiella rhizophila]|nr:hypothetical protein BT69DRAFT_1325562 [Atractiella rhizophila]
MKTLFSVLTIAALAAANTPISRSTLESEGVYRFVLASRPKWWFGIPSVGLCPSRTAPCYPEPAVNHTTGEQNPGAGLCAWPNANCGCLYPSESGERNVKGRAFPHYYIAHQCSSTEVRAGFWVYYPKDGHTGTGHRHDWEYYLVIWSSASATGDFTRSSHVFSYHGDRLQEAWSSASTVDDDLNDAADGEGNHALVYPGWSKHPNFPDRNIRFCDVLSQSTKNAYRSHDWWYYADESDLINAEASTQIGGWIDAIGDGWGSATGYPSVRGGDGRICGLNGTGGTILRTQEEREAAWDAIDAVTLTELNLSEAEIRKRCNTEE